jgi:Fe-S cluster assembly protein SufD
MGASNVASTTQSLETYAEGFSGLEKDAVGCKLPWLRSLRQSGFARFNAVGFPTMRDEDWRFTNLAPIVQTPFRLVRNGRAFPPLNDSGFAFGHISNVSRFFMPGAACRLAFIDGRFFPSLSSVAALPRGVTVASLASELEKNPAAIEPHLGRYLNIQRDPFSALNTAFIEDGAFVHFAKNVIAEAPIHLLFVSTPHEFPAISHPRNLIVAEESSQATIVEDYVSLGGKALCNTATELVAGDNSVISHYMIEREDIEAFNLSTLRIQQGRAADVASHSVLIGGALVRNNVHPVLTGEGGQCLINGLFVGGDRQHLDNYMLVEHASPHCGSRQFYNGILAGHAHGVFHGRIIVHKDAQKTDAKQTNRNLLLSDTAQIDTKPQLEIYADDVKCTHGATIGQIEEDALFYLRSRGIDEVSARRLLLMAFANECLDRMKEGPARTHVESLIHDYVAGVTGSVSSEAPQAAVGEAK